MATLLRQAEQWQLTKFIPGPPSCLTFPLKIGPVFPRWRVSLTTLVKLATGLVQDHSAGFLSFFSLCHETSRHWAFISFSYKYLYYFLLDSEKRTTWLVINLVHALLHDCMLYKLLWDIWPEITFWLTQSVIFLKKRLICSELKA